MTRRGFFTALFVVPVVAVSAKESTDWALERVQQLADGNAPVFRDMNTDAKATAIIALRALQQR
jgi:hypothetical protein